MVLVKATLTTYITNFKLVALGICTSMPPFYIRHINVAPFANKCMSSNCWCIPNILVTTCNIHNYIITQMLSIEMSMARDKAPRSLIPIHHLQRELSISRIGRESPVHDNSLFLTLLLCLPWFNNVLLLSGGSGRSLDASFAAKGHFGTNKWCMTSIITYWWIIHGHFIV